MSDETTNDCIFDLVEEKKRWDCRRRKLRWARTAALITGRARIPAVLPARPRDSDRSVQTLPPRPADAAHVPLTLHPRTLKTTLWLCLWHYPVRVTLKSATMVAGGKQVSYITTKGRISTFSLADDVHYHFLQQTNLAAEKLRVPGSKVIQIKHQQVSLHRHSHLYINYYKSR